MIYLSILGIALCVLSAFFLYLFKKPLKIEDRLLILWVLLMGGKFVLDLVDLQNGSRYVTEVRMSIGVSFYIFIFLHLKYLTEKRSSFRLLDLLFFLHIPFLMGYMAYTGYSDYDKVQLEYPNARRIVHYSYAFSSIIFSLLAFIILWRHNKQLKQFYSYSSPKLDLLWVGGLLFYNMFAVVIIWILAAGNEIRIHVPAYFNVNYIILIFCLTVLRSWQDTVTPTLERDVRYNRSSLDQAKVEGLISKLKEHMERNKPFIENDFNLKHLSDQIQLPKHHLSELLNKHMKTSFYNFIRDYRVNHVIKLLGNKEYQNFKLLSIAYDSGFNSKSNFNKAFKEVTGRTPSEFQNSQDDL